MYKDYFGLIEAPFSIVPSARYLFLSNRHREAMAHLQAGLGEGGGFAMLTGEVGTGKTTVSKAMLASLSENVKAGLILNPTFSETDLLEAICDEFEIQYPENASLKQLTGAINQYLLQNHEKGIQTLLLIDEAQHLSTQVLEQLRLLTNLETDSRKLLKVLLVGQPELQIKLQTGELRQLAQRITGRYHLLPLTEQEVSQYIEFRMKMAGAQRAIFEPKALKIIAHYTQGVPRLINLICDKALLYTFYNGENEVSSTQAEQACKDVMSFQAPVAQNTQFVKPRAFPFYFSATMIGLIALGIVLKFSDSIAHRWQSYFPAVPVVELAKEDQFANIGPMLQAFINNSLNLTDSMQVLYSLWGVSAPLSSADCFHENMPFHCETRYGELDDILSEKRPVVLTLRSQESTFFAVLYAVYEDKVELINGRQRIVVPAQWLKNAWNGEYQKLWYSEIGEVLRLNSRGTAVAKLDLLLAKALEQAPIGDDTFTKRLENRVRAFQVWQGLSDDGVVGKRTLKRLDLITTDFAPQIQKADKLMATVSTEEINSAEEINRTEEIN